MMITTNSCSYGNGCNPSQRTFHLPSFGNPGLFPSDPSHPAHIIATVVSNPPLPGRFILLVRSSKRIRESKLKNYPAWLMFVYGNM